LKSLVISLDYRSYMGSSARIWSFRWLFLYLCSHNLDGSVTSMTLEELILLFIPKSHFFQGAKLSKVALPYSKATKRMSSNYWEWGSEVLLNVLCVERGGAPIFIQKPRRCLEAILGASLTPTALACFHATTTSRGGWAAPVGGRPPLVVDRPLTEPPHHHLHVVGLGLDQDCFPMGFCPGWIDLMAISLVPLPNTWHGY
jgi:hypothetical protein